MGQNVLQIQDDTFLSGDRKFGRVITHPNSILVGVFMIEYTEYPFQTSVVWLIPL